MVSDKPLYGSSSRQDIQASSLYNGRRGGVVVSQDPHPQSVASSQTKRWDAVDAWFECITQCPVDAGDDCITRCVRTHLGEEQELWQSSLCM